MVVVRHDDEGLRRSGTTRAEWFESVAADHKHIVMTPYFRPRHEFERSQLYGARTSAAPRTPLAAPGRQRGKRPEKPTTSVRPERRRQLGPAQLRLESYL